MRRNDRIIAAFLILFLALSIPPSKASGQSQPAAGYEPADAAQTTTAQDQNDGIIAVAPLALAPEIETLTNEIVSKEIELLRFNTNYRIFSTKLSRPRSWRMWLYNEGHFAINNAGITTVAYSRWKYWRTPKQLPLRLAKAGPTMLLIGHSVLAGGLVLETCLDAISDYRTKRKGFDRKTATSHVQRLTSDLERLIALREEAIRNNQSLSADEKRVLSAEGAVLRDVKNAALLEYSKFNIRAARWKAGRNTSQMVALAGATTGGFIGSLMSLEAVVHRRPRLAGASGLGFTLSGALIVVNPLLTRLSMIAAGKLAKHRTARELQGLDARANEAFEADKQLLASLLSGSAQQGDVLRATANRLPIYQMEKGFLDKQAAMAMADAKAANRELIERTIMNAAIGGTKVGYGIQLMNAGFGFHPTPNRPNVNVKFNLGGRTITTTLPKRRGGTELFNKQVAQAATTFIPGTGIGIIDALQAKARGELQIFRQSGLGTSAEVTLKKRLADLDRMDEQLKAIRIQP